MAGTGIVWKFHRSIVKVRKRLVDLETEVIPEAEKKYFSGYNPPSYDSFLHGSDAPILQTAFMILAAGVLTFLLFGAI